MTVWTWQAAAIPAFMMDNWRSFSFRPREKEKKIPNLIPCLSAGISEFLEQGIAGRGEFSRLTEQQLNFLEVFCSNSTTNPDYQGWQVVRRQSTTTLPSFNNEYSIQKRCC